MRRKSIILISSLAVAIATLTLAVFTGRAERLSLVTENVGMEQYGAVPERITYRGMAVLEGDIPATAGNVKSLERCPFAGYNVSGIIYVPSPSELLGTPKSSDLYAFKEYIAISKVSNRSVIISEPVNLRVEYGGKFSFSSSRNVLTTDGDVVIYAVYRYKGYKVECIPCVETTDNIGGGKFVGGGKIAPGGTLELNHPNPDSSYRLGKLHIEGDNGLRFDIENYDIGPKIIIEATEKSFNVYRDSNRNTVIEICTPIRIYAVFVSEDPNISMAVVRSIPDNAMRLTLDTGNGVQRSDGVVTSELSRTAKSMIAGYNNFNKNGEDWYDFLEGSNFFDAAYFVDTDGSVKPIRENTPQWATMREPVNGSREVWIELNQSVLKETKCIPEIIVPCKLKNDAYKYAAITGCEPYEGGSAVATIRSRKEAFGTQITAYPNDGYDFDYWSWNENGVEKTSHDRQMNVYIDGLKYYTAHFKRAYYKVSVVEMKPSNGGRIDGEGYYKKTTSPTTIKLYANTDYELESCNYVTSDGINHSATIPAAQTTFDFEIPEIKEDIALHVSFKSLKYKVSTHPQEDANGCTSYISNTVTVGTDREVEARDDDTLYLKATPDEKHNFQYWKNSKGAIIKGAKDGDSYTATVTAAGADEYTAYFNNKNNQIYLTEYPNDAEVGKVSFNMEVPTTGGVYDTERGKNVTLKATVVDGNYDFSEWQITDPDGRAMPSNTSNPLNMPNYNPEKDGQYVYTAVFKPIQCIINANATPASMGRVTIGDGKTKDGTEGSRTVDKGTQVVLTAIPADMGGGKFYIPEYWTDDAGNSYQGEMDIIEDPASPDPSNPNYLIINRLKVTATDARKTYTAHFSQSESTITIYSDPSDKGLVQFNNEPPTEYGYYSVTGFSTFTLNAVPVDSRYKFKEWTWKDNSGNNKSSTSPQLTLPKIEGDTEFKASFEDALYEIKVEKYPSSSGKVYIDGAETSSYSYKGGTDHKIMAMGDDKYAFKYWEDSQGRQYTGTWDSEWTGTYPRNYLEIKSIQENQTFTAVFAKKRVKLGAYVTPAGSPLGGKVEISAEGKTAVSGSGSETMEISSESSVIVTQTPQSNFKFQHWEYKDWKTGKDVQSTEETLSFSGITDDTNFRAVYVPKRHKVTIFGINCLAVSGGKQAGDAGAEIYVDDGADITVSVLHEWGSTTTYKDYKLEYWKLIEKGTTKRIEASGDSITLKNITGDCELYAQCAANKGNLYISAYPTDAGEVQFADNPPTRGQEYKISTDLSVTVKAIESNPEYRFARWEYVYPPLTDDSKARHFTATTNPLVLINIGDILKEETQTVECYAIFEKAQYKVSTKSSPLDGGTLLIGGERAEQDVEAGGTVKLIAKPADGYMLDYIKDSEGVKYQVNDYYYDEEDDLVYASFSVPPVFSDVTYTGYFIKMDLSVSAYCAPFDAGVVDINGSGYEEYVTYDTYFYDTVTLTAKPKDTGKYKFERWEDEDGNVYSNNPLVVSNIKKSMTFTAIFVKEKEEQGFRVVASPPIGGFVSKVYNGDGTATITADANKGYRFSCWKKGDKIIANTPVATVDDLSAGTTYTAYFLKSAAYNDRSDITKTHYYEEKRRMSQPVYVVTKDTLKNQATTQILEDKANYANSTPPLKSYTAVQHAKDYFASHKKGGGFVFLDGELFTTKSELMPIKMVLSQEDVLAEAVDFSARKFGDRYDVEVLAVVDVTMPDDFAEGPRTYMWRNTGAQFKDNVYVMYMHDGKSDYHWSTAVLDMYDDMEQQYEVLRFSIPGTGRLDRIAAIRVKIKEE